MLHLTKFSPSLQELLQKNFFVSDGEGSSEPNKPPGSAPARVPAKAGEETGPPHNTLAPIHGPVSV